MNARAQGELNAIRNEIASIIRELDSIADGVRRDFVGIGNDKCAQSLDKAANNYRYVKRQLDNLDLVTTVEGFILPT